MLPLGAPLAALAATLRVPSQFPTIKGAVDAASSGDTVRIARGVFAEQVSSGKDLKLVGAEAGHTT